MSLTGDIELKQAANNLVERLAEYASQKLTVAGLQAEFWTASRLLDEARIFQRSQATTNEQDRVNKKLISAGERDAFVEMLIQQGTVQERERYERARRTLEFADADLSVARESLRVAQTMAQLVIASASGGAL